MPNGEHHDVPMISSSTMCGMCGDNQLLAYETGNFFEPHANRWTGQPCPGEPIVEDVARAIGRLERRLDGIESRLQERVQRRYAEVNEYGDCPGCGASSAKFHDCLCSGPGPRYWERADS